jgi:hypothetical protein
MLFEGTRSTGKSVNCTDQPPNYPPLAAQSTTVGLLDAGIYGPSLPQMLGIASGRPQSADAKGLEPMDAHGIRATSIGFLIDPEQPMVSRIGDPPPLPQVSRAARAWDGHRTASTTAVECPLTARTDLPDS